MEIRRAGFFGFPKVMGCLFVRNLRWLEDATSPIAAVCRGDDDDQRGARLPAAGWECVLFQWASAGVSPRAVGSEVVSVFLARPPAPLFPSAACPRSAFDTRSRESD